MLVTLGGSVSRNGSVKVILAEKAVFLVLDRMLSFCSFGLFCWLSIRSRYRVRDFFSEKDFSIFLKLEKLTKFLPYHLKKDANQLSQARRR